MTFVTVQIFIQQTHFLRPALAEALPKDAPFLSRPSWRNGGGLARHSNYSVCVSVCSVCVCVCLTSPIAFGRSRNNHIALCWSSDKC